MRGCPSLRELELLLAEQLNETRQQAIETHVEACATCQRTLARLSDPGTELNASLFGTSPAGALATSDIEFVRQLQKHPPAAQEPAFPLSEQSQVSPITFPGPPSAKGPLGHLEGFAIRKELGAGRFGIVYEAYDELDRLVAIKVLKPELAASTRERARFENEARKAAAVKHDHIITIHQVGHSSSFALPYLVMEYVEGEALSDRLQREGVMEPREAAQLVRQIAMALASAHARGLIHRDIKPSNILLEAGSGRAKLTDFGLARIADAVGGSTSQSGRIVGTPAYMSPEQVASPHQVDGRSDVYSLGVVLYELLVGERPFRGATHLLLQQVVHDEPRSPRKLNDRSPRDLETICLKAMAKSPGRRYATAAQLAEDLRRFLAGEPIQARPVGKVEKCWRWCRRNPAFVTLGSCMAGLLGLLVWGGYEAHGRLKAQALRDRLLDANTNEVPAIVRDMAPYRRWLDPLLYEASANAEKDRNRRKQLHTSLALLPVDASQVRYLNGSLLGAQPDEVPAIREALASHKEELVDTLWAVVKAPEKGKESQRLRAAAALAVYDADSVRWTKCSPLVVQDLVLENAIFLGRWAEMYRPVKNSFLAPLADIFRDRQAERAAERTLALNLLADYAADQPRVLADLLMDADEKQFGVLYPRFQEQAERGLPVLTGEIDQKPVADATDEAKEKLAKRQANAAVVLLRMTQPAKVWPMLKHSPDPRVRSYLIHRFRPLGADAGLISNRLEEEPSKSIQRALLLSLGEYDGPELASDTRKTVLAKVQEMYRTATDPGLHAAAEWLLRRWHQQAWLKQINGEWARDKSQREERLHGIQQAVRKQKEKTPPQWYVTSQGQTMVVLPGPVEFVMGSPPSEVGGGKDEVQHKQAIGRTFALAATAVTVEQYRRFAPGFRLGPNARWAPTADCPRLGATWFEAVAYCNWLSEQEGLPQSQWCYEPLQNPKAMPALAVSSVGLLAGSLAPLAATCGFYPARTKPEYKGGMKLAADYLWRTGYRLPTEAEVEYATRAGSLTSRYFGETEELVAKYAWHNHTSKDHTWPVGSLKPNDFGLFDMQGNVYCWCQERYKKYPPSQDEQANEDQEDSLTINEHENRVLRGGSFTNYPVDVRSAARSQLVPSYDAHSVGFRPARTLR